jgi:2-(1,2-epoxy-1,2-dihydrophenyl)acetyl-CoA isomerase
MASAQLLREFPEPGVVLLTLNRPEQLNAVTMSLQEELDDALTKLESDPDVRCVVLTGAGDRAFSAGYDVREMANWSEEELLAGLERREPWIWHAATTPLPMIVALNGLTYGVGAIIATGADVRIGCPATVFKFTAGAHGGANATWTLPTIVGRGLAAELLMTARDVGSEEARDIGLLNRVVDSSVLLDTALNLARQIAENPPPGTRAIKRLLREHEGRTIADRFLAENLAMRGELRPRPISELYADFLKESGEAE